MSTTSTGPAPDVLPEKTIFVPGVYSWANKGDVALLQSFIPWLGRHINVKGVVLTSFEPKQDAQHLEGAFIDMVSRPRTFLRRVTEYLSQRIPRLRKIRTRFRLIWFWQTCRYLRAWARIHQKNPQIARLFALPHVTRVARAIDNSDLVISVPGGYLNATTFVNDWWLFHIPTLVLAKALGKPPVLGACSIGPFDRSHIKHARFALSIPQLILVREDLSHALALDLGVDSSRLVISPDMAFGFEQADSTVASAAVLKIISDYSQGRPVVGVSVRDHDFPGCADPKAKQAQYLQCVADSLLALQRQHNACIVIFPQTLEDLKVGRDLATIVHANYGDALNLDNDLTPADLQCLYRETDLLVGVRMHANILSMCVGTPVVAIAYEPKTVGILEAMNLSEWGLWIDQLDQNRLVNLVKAHWENRIELGKLAAERSSQQVAQLADVGSNLAGLLSHTAKEFC